MGTPNLNLKAPGKNMVPVGGDFLTAILGDLATLDVVAANLSATNLLTNPGFEVNQRGLSSYAGDGSYSLDRWKIAYTGGVTLTVAPDAVTADAGSSQSARATFVKGGGTSATLEQKVEIWYQLRGVTISLRMRAKASVANAARLFLTDGVTTAYSAYHSGSGNWETLTLTFTPSPVATDMRLGADFRADCTAYLDNATLVLGSVPLPYVQILPQLELQRCQRYYETVQNVSQVGYSDDNTRQILVTVQWKVTKAGIATVTKTGTWTTINCGQPVVGSVTADGATAYAVAAGAGFVSYNTNSSDDALVAEWNP